MALYFTDLDGNLVTYFSEDQRILHRTFEICPKKTNVFCTGPEVPGLRHVIRLHGARAGDPKAAGHGAARTLRGLPWAGQPYGGRSPGR